MSKANLTGEKRIYSPVELQGIAGVAEYLGLDKTRAGQLLKEMEITPAHTDWLGSKLVSFFNSGAIEEQLKELSEKEGIVKEEAALYMGLQLQSFTRIAETITIRSLPSDKYLPIFLDAFMAKYLPANKFWSSWSAHKREFMENFTAKEGIWVKPQMCEIDGCGNIASDRCSNEKCRDGNHPRFVCLIHGEWIENDNRPITMRPNVICTECLKK